ncbi:hypothetical protein LINPERHAP2_LOCUS11236 [Linum perenne]
MKWHCPPEGVIKCNIDAAVFAESNKVGAGLCLRDNNGRMLKFKSLCKMSRAPVKEGEAWALWEGLKWAVEENLTQMMFENDAKTVVDSIHGDLTDHTEFGDWITRCQEILANHTSFQVLFVKRSFNVVADAIAWISCSLPSPSIGAVPPAWLSCLLTDFCLNTTH